MSVPLDYINCIVSNVASEINLTEWCHTEQKFEAIAQNYFGVLIPITLTGKIHEDKVTFNLILKLAPTDERYRVSGAITLMFAKEIFVYSTVLSAYKKLQQNFTPESKFIMPTCFFICKDYCKEAIVMQDMTLEGYKPYSKGMFLDLNHLIVSVRCLAKFHAFSFILERRDEHLFKEIAETCAPLNEHVNKRFIDVLNDRLGKAIQIFEKTQYVLLLKSFKDNCGTMLKKTAENVKATAICHGDIWKDNILFQYEGDTPTSACIIDYQTARMSSPAFDVLYLITSSTDSELRGKDFHNLLNVYYETFEQVLSDAKLNPKEVYTREDFEDDLKVVAPACFITANTAMWLSHGLQAEGHVRSKQVLKTEEEKTKAVDKYKGVIRAIIDDFTSFGYFAKSV